MKSTASVENRDNAPRWPRLGGWGVLHMILGVVLLTAAGLKGYQLATQPLPDGGFLTSRPLMIAVVEGELLLGLWLLSGLATRAAWAISLVCFAVFTCVSAYKGISGEAACGCFGNFHVNPWVTATFDLAMTAALLVFRPELGRSLPPRFARLRFAGVGLAAVLAGGIGGYAMASFEPVTVTGEGSFSDTGSVVLLKPEEWVSEPFPLLGHIDIGERLAEGHWLVVLYHHDCPVCQDEVPKYEQMAYRNQRRGEGPRIALVGMPPYAPPGEKLVPSSSPATLGKLSDAKEWFVTTPSRVELRSGVVVEASEGETLPPISGTEDASRGDGRAAATHRASERWLTDIVEAKALAKAQGKTMLIDFYADWCKPCQMMEERTLADERVRQRLRSFVLVKIDIDRRRGLMRKYEVGAIPATLLITPSGRILARRVGYVPAGPYLRFLETAG